MPFQAIYGTKPDYLSIFILKFRKCEIVVVISGDPVCWLTSPDVSPVMGDT